MDPGPTQHTPPQAPEIGRMHRLLGSFSITGVFWYRLHRFGMRILPSWTVPFFIALFTAFFYVALRRIARAIASNLEVILGPCGFIERQVRVYRTFWNFAWCVSERYERMDSEHRGSMDIEGVEYWNAAEASPEGFIVVTAHIGHWEVGSMLVPSRHVHVVREHELDPKAQKFMEEMFRGDTANTTMHFVGKSDASLAPRLLSALRRGEIVALQGDRPRTTGRTATCELFGQRLDLPLGPAALARAAQVSLLPVYVFRKGRRLSRTVVRPPIRVTEPGIDGMTQAIQQVAREVEWAIREAPFQWFCFRELWPKSKRSNHPS